MLISVYFAEKWPDWFHVFLASCAKNPTIEWQIYSNCPPPSFSPVNVKIVAFRPSDFIELVQKKLSIDIADSLFNSWSFYKLIDLKAAFGYLFEDQISNYDIFGFGDIDVIYGNIRSFYTDDVLGHNVISTHNPGISGHFVLFQNSKPLREAFMHVPNWRVKMASPIVCRFDEDIFPTVMKYPSHLPEWARKIYDLLDYRGAKRRTNHYFHEQFSTPLTPLPWLGGRANHPEVWYWQDGKITNCDDGDRTFLYLHLMNYKSATWMDIKYGTRAPWHNIRPFVNVTVNELSNGARIDLTGIHPLTRPLGSTSFSANIVK